MPDRKKRVIGTAGHIDHGKTALVRALTGVDCDRLPEEKRRGITIDLGFASWITEEVQIGFVDVPGHERFVKNMLAGVGGIDCALLVVAADESIMPQTREHLAICRLLAIPAGVVAITKSDLVERDIIDLVRLEIEELVSGSFLEGKPIVPVSSVTSEGIPELQAALIAAVASVPDRDHTTRVFRLPIDRAFTLKGFGSIVTGTALSGELRSDADVELLPSGLRSRARTIQVHGAARELAVAGERTSINLADLALDQLERGEQVVEPRTLTPSQIITARLDLLPDSRPLKDQARVRFHHLAAELLGSVRLIAADRKEIAPGASEFVQIRLESPVVATAGDRFVIRRYSPAITIGGRGIRGEPRRSSAASEPRDEARSSRDAGPRQPRGARFAACPAGWGVGSEPGGPAGPHRHPTGHAPPGAHREGAARAGGVRRSGRQAMAASRHARGAPAPGHDVSSEVVRGESDLSVGAEERVRAEARA